MQQPGNMKTELQAILERLRRDAKNYRLAAAAFLVYAVVVTLLFGTICPLAAMTGMPCPGCGSTRALFLVLTGRFVEACRYNPCIYLWILLAVYVGWQRYIRGEKSGRGTFSDRCGCGRHDSCLFVSDGGGLSRKPAHGLSGGECAGGADPRI